MIACLWNHQIWILKTSDYYAWIINQNLDFFPNAVQIDYT